MVLESLNSYDFFLHLLVPRCSPNLFFSTNGSYSFSIKCSLFFTHQAYQQKLHLLEKLSLFYT